VTSPASVAYPLGAPTFTGTTLTVDIALQEPRRISRRIADMSLQKFIVDRIFMTSAVPVTGGAVIFEQATLNELYANRDVERVAPGQEFPIVGSERPAPKVAEVEKWGGKVFVTDEARRRNQTTYFDNQITQLANTIVRKVNQRAVETLEAAIAALGGAGVITAPAPWSAVVTTGTNATTATEWPHAAFALAQQQADIEELGVTYDLWLINPIQAGLLRMVYGADLSEMLSSNNVSTFVSNRVPTGVAYAVASGQVGGMEYEQGVFTETWREPKTERTWVQTSVRPVMYVTNPFSVKKIVGLAS
jgi:hypothetical protein